MARIGVEQSLTNVSAALREKGHEVVELRQEADAQGCDFCVVSGTDSNVMGMQDVSIQGSVIEASGLSADEVCRQIDQKSGNIQ
ncbi:MAG: YkuS family protein [Mesobacillus sp.]|uniref:YkuS family protein n=1 Tax=Bacillaceae TaxID=186817 RepID=UPI002FFDB6C2